MYGLSTAQLRSVKLTVSDLDKEEICSVSFAARFADIAKEFGESNGNAVLLAGIDKQISKLIDDLGRTSKSFSAVLLTFRLQVRADLGKTKSRQRDVKRIQKIITRGKYPTDTKRKIERILNGLGATA
jgi:hypothetical protein